MAPVASGGGGAGGGAGGGGGASGRQQLCVKPCCNDLNTRYSLMIHNNLAIQAFWVCCSILLGAKFTCGCSLSNLPSWIHKVNFLLETQKSL